MPSTILSDYSNYASSDEGMRGNSYVRTAAFFLSGCSSLSLVALFSTSRSTVQEPSAAIFLLAILLSSLFSLIPIMFKKSSFKSNLMTHACFLTILVIMSIIVVSCHPDHRIMRLVFLLLIIITAILTSILRSYSLKRICQMKDQYLFVFLCSEDFLQFLIIAVRMIPVIILISCGISPSSTPGRHNSTSIALDSNSSSDSPMEITHVIDDHNSSSMIPAVVYNSSEGAMLDFMDKVADYFEDIKYSDVYFLFSEKRNSPLVSEVIKRYPWTGFLFTSKIVMSAALLLIILSWSSLIFLQSSPAARRENTLQKGVKKSVHLVSFRKRFEAELDELSSESKNSTLRTGFASGDEESHKKSIFYSLTSSGSTVNDQPNNLKHNVTGKIPDIVTSSFNQLNKRKDHLKHRLIDTTLIGLLFAASFCKAILSFSLPLVFKSNIITITLIMSFFGLMPLGSVLASYTSQLMTSVKKFGQQVYQSPYPKRKNAGEVLLKTNIKSLCIVTVVMVLMTGLAVSILLGEIREDDGQVVRQVDDSHDLRPKRDLPSMMTGDRIGMSGLQDAPVRAVGLMTILVLVSIGCAFVSSTAVFLVKSRSKSTSGLTTPPGSLSSPTPAALAAFQQLHQSHQNQMLTASAVAQAGLAAGSAVAYFLIYYHITW